MDERMAKLQERLDRAENIRSRDNQIIFDKTSFFIKAVSLCVMFIIGIIVMRYGIKGKVFYLPSYGRYGGDAYTDIQNTMADSAQNIASLGAMVSKAFVFAGMLIMVASVYMFANLLKKKN